MKRLVLPILCVLVVNNLNSQQISLAEKLGYSPDTKLLIVHADDAAVSHATNQAVIDAFEKGVISSTAIMVPCPWFPEMAEYARNHVEYDFGLHLTFTSEWNTYRWAGLSPVDEISSLLDDQGYFYATTGEAVQHAIVTEVEKEIRAQIEKALASGIKPTHFDTHMNTLFGNQELFEVYLNLGREYQVPVLLPQNYLDLNDSLHIPESYNPVIINEIFEADTDVLPEDWVVYYNNLLQNLKPGLYELIFHLAYDNEETRAMTKGFEHYDVAWRQRDVNYAMSDEFRKIVKENNIQPITWRQIQQVMYPR